MQEVFLCVPSIAKLVIYSLMVSGSRSVLLLGTHTVQFSGRNFIGQLVSWLRKGKEFVGNLSVAHGQDPLKPGLRVMKVS